jgi:hypothetical protein
MEDMQSPGRFEELRIAYEAAFERFCGEVRTLKSQEAAAQPEPLAELRLRVAEAEAAYRETRDALASFLMEQQLRAAELAQVA